MQIIAKPISVFQDELELKVSPEYMIGLKTLDHSKEYVVNIEEKGKKRTLAQNRLLWKLCHEISERTYSKDDEAVYCEALEKAGAKTDYLSCIPEAERNLRETFRAVRFVGTDGRMNTYKVYYGSSKFNTKEMTTLIETILDMAMEVGLDNVESWREMFEL